MVTIQDIADKCGVTKMTVSRALSGNGSVNSDTRRKIEETAAKLQYEPNSHARKMAGTTCRSPNQPRRRLVVGSF